MIINYIKPLFESTTFPFPIILRYRVLQKCKTLNLPLVHYFYNMLSLQLQEKLARETCKMKDLPVNNTLLQKMTTILIRLKMKIY